ncbi:hypothetical protein MBLNU230_g0798t1 [Neophaeotheca triangularis]
MASAPDHAAALNGPYSMQQHQDESQDQAQVDNDQAPLERPGLKRQRTSKGSMEKRSESMDDPLIVPGESAEATLKRFAQEPLDYPRRRATIACEICRSRKSRCDGARPKCRLCTELNAECNYREPGIKLDAGDKLILEQLARIENMLHSGISSNATSASLSGASAGPISPATSNTTSDDVGTKRLSNAGPTQATPLPLNGLGTWNANISTMPKTHTTPALHLLQWPVIRDLVSRQCDPQVLLQLEMSREPLDLSIRYSLDPNNVDTYARTYFSRVNVWYACVNPYNWAATYHTAVSNAFRSGPESCMVLLVLALGEAAHSGQSISHLPRGQPPPGLGYFAAAWSLLPTLMTRNDVPSAQCHILAAAYLLYLVRPLEAWNLLYNTSMKLQLLLSSPSRIPSSLKELSERVYWNTLMIESDLLAEIDLPHSGIVQFEENMRLPRSFPVPYDQPPQVRPGNTSMHSSSPGSTHSLYTVSPSAAAVPASYEETPNQPPGNDDLWYFLAEIALRRLLNRVSHLMYTHKTTQPRTQNPSNPHHQSLSSLDPVAAELDFQLTQWYENLPTPVKFPRERLPAGDQVQTVLRLRYFACRTIIFRPYILAVLGDETGAVAREPGVQDACRKCLEACIRQLEDLDAHHQGHLPYLLQGALSLVSQALLLMGASLNASLSALLPPAGQMDVLFAEVVMEVERLGVLAPSIRLCAEIVREAEERRQVLRARGRG